MKFIRSLVDAYLRRRSGPMSTEVFEQPDDVDSSSSLAEELARRREMMKAMTEVER